MVGIIPTQKSANVPLVMGMLIRMVTLHRDAYIPRFSVICVVLDLVMALADKWGGRPKLSSYTRPLVAGVTSVTSKRLKS